MPHSNDSIVLDIDMLARVFNLNVFSHMRRCLVGCGGGVWGAPSGSSSSTLASDRDLIGKFSYTLLML